MAVMFKNNRSKKFDKLVKSSGSSLALLLVSFLRFWRLRCALAAAAEVAGLFWALFHCRRHVSSRALLDASLLSGVPRSDKVAASSLYKPPPVN